MWHSVLKVVEVAMEKRYLIDNDYCASNMLDNRHFQSCFAR